MVQMEMPIHALSSKNKNTISYLELPSADLNSWNNKWSKLELNLDSTVETIRLTSKYKELAETKNENENEKRIELTS